MPGTEVKDKAKADYLMKSDYQNKQLYKVIDIDEVNKILTKKTVVLFLLSEMERRCQFDGCDRGPQTTHCQSHTMCH